MGHGLQTSGHLVAVVYSVTHLVVLHLVVTQLQCNTFVNLYQGTNTDYYLKSNASEVPTSILRVKDM